MKKNKLWLLTFLTIALLAFVTACGNSSSSGDSKDSKGNASNKDEASGSITISGSSAMQPLVLAAAEKFMDKHPKADIQKYKPAVQEQDFPSFRRICTNW